MIVDHWTGASRGAAGPHVERRAAEFALDVAELLPLFAYAHLPPALATASQPFGELAADLVAAVPEPSLQLIEALTHLLKAKDAAVRARLIKPTPAPTK